MATVEGTNGGSTNAGGKGGTLEARGTTPDGKSFVIPQTYDVVEAILDPAHKKTWLDAPVLVFLVGQVLLGLGTLLGVLHIPKLFFLFLTVFWRLAYNVGLGWILRKQSEERAFVRWARKLGLGLSDEEMDKRAAESKSRDGAFGQVNSWRWTFLKALKREIQAKSGPEYSEANTPLEFKAWVLFRSFVDIVLVSDVAAFFIVAFLYARLPVTPEVASLPPSLSNNLRYLANGMLHFGLTDVSRIVAGLFISFFSLWVKADAHRVVTDYAWYWGDFFFLKSASLTFDGAFDVWFHPMYSLGYAHYYAATLIAQSYTVLFVSLFAHACQFAFLYLVENPHIEKIYGSSSDDAASPSGSSGSRSTAQPHELKVFFRNDMVVLDGFDWMRSSDLSSVLVMAQSVAFSLWFGKELSVAWLVCQAIVWRTLFTWGTAFVLHFQSKTRFWNKHFLKNGEGIKEGFDNWKRIYNLTMVMTYVSFGLLAFRIYEFPGVWLRDWKNWTEGDTLLRHMVGIMLVCLHIWTSFSIYEVLGDYGWFYGDFFLPPPSSGVKYTGIYRFLNNPEKVMGQASLWGITLICGSWTLFAVSIFGHVSSYLFLEYVEAPHMRRVYGSSVRELGGIERVLLKEVRETLSNPVVAPLVESVSKAGQAVDVKVIGRRVEDLGKEVMERLSVEVLEKVEDEVLKSSTVPETWKEGIRRRRARKVRHGDRSNTSRHTRSPSDSARSDDGTWEISSGLHNSNHESRRSSTEGDTTPVMSEDDEPRSQDEKSLSGSSARSIKPIPSLTDIFSTISGSQQPIPIPIPEIGAKVTYPANFERLKSAYAVSLLANDANKPSQVVFGEHLRLCITVPSETLGAKDWIGLYRVGDNPQTLRTTVRSAAKWVYISTGRGVGDDVDEDYEEVQLSRLRSGEGATRRTVTLDEGGEVEVLDVEVELRGDRLPWLLGCWEARLHHDGGYGCLAISKPFDVVTDKLDESVYANEQDLSNAILPVTRRCLDVGDNLTVDTDIAVFMAWPMGGAPRLGPRQKQREEMSRRIVYAIQYITGLEFSWRVVGIAGSVRELSKKILEARKTLISN
ncbi:hypothetical protein M427DRAFT_58356 [Gonapodya prolifera JEL478]|uniref:Phosphatidylethanolamine N-methyltransferase n=1 Tax=Gonapodya prolifera (strain JEL478) TaxID=1344416 RepID=A0A139AA82_GONPJ|nr:hypothetical protein M427DRAFT_58356 [Gonapodya prolifera JEL478]|eukprot:KXS13762.1 hypothetical protein M427DRAFT_58356 [Gonapodya prolifera JEL478]